MLKENLSSSVCFNLNKELCLKKYYIFILIVFIIFFLCLFIPFNEYKKYYLYIDNNNYKLIVDEDFFPIKKDNLYIDKVKYKYEVLSISDGSLINNKKYYEVMLSLNLNKDILTTKNIVEVNLKIRKISLAKKIIKEIK